MRQIQIKVKDVRMVAMWLVELDSSAVEGDRLKLLSMTTLVRLFYLR